MLAARLVSTMSAKGSACGVEDAPAGDAAGVGATGEEAGETDLLTSTKSAQGSTLLIGWAPHDHREDEPSCRAVGPFLPVAHES